jgi:PAS domain S-box-containing protein
MPTRHHDHKEPNRELPDICAVLWHETNDSLLIMDETGTIIQANRAAAGNLEYTAAELNNMPMALLCPPGERDEAAEDIRKVITGKSDQCSITLQAKSGRLISANIRFVRGQWQGRSVWLGINASISPATDMLEQFMKLFNDNPALISINSLKSGRFIEVNQRFLQTLGFKRREVVGRRGQDLGIIVEVRELARIYRAIVKKGFVKNLEIQLRDKHGRYHAGLCTANLIEHGDKQFVLSIVYDITEKRRIEKEVLESKAQMQAILDNLPFLAWLQDKQGKYIAVNKRFEAICGKSKAEIIGKTDSDVWPGNLAARYHLNNTAELAGKMSQCIEDHAEYHQDGLWFEIFRTPACDMNGNIIGIVGMVRNITERKTLEIELERQKRFLKTMMDAIPDLVFYKDRQGIYLGCNQADAKRFMGLSETEIVGKTDFELMKDRALAEFFRKKDMEVLTTGQTRINDETITLVDGTVMDVETVKTPFYDEQGNVAGLIGIARDITARKKYEEELAKRDYLLWSITLCIKALLDNRNYYEAILSCFAILGEGLRVHRIYLFQNHDAGSENGTASQIARWNSAEVKLRRRPVKLRNIPLTEIGEYIEVLTQGLAIFGVARKTKNHRIRAYLEKQDILSVAVLPVFVEKNLWGFIGFGDCRTERKWTNEESTILYTFANSVGKALERSFIEEELESSRKAAETATILKSQFLANMSHEIRTPMNGIIGFLDILQQSDLSLEQQEYVKEAKSASEALLYLINDILDFSKIEAGKLSMECIPFNIRTAVEDAVSIQIPKALEKQLEIHTMIKSNVPEQLEGDPARLRQVLNNLLSNAVKFTKDGEINITVECVEIKSDLACLRFEVQDTGIGIKGEDIGKLFRPFVQADASTTRQYGGTGLGLAISKELVGMMNGEIGVTSTPGKESKFYFTAWFKIVSFGNAAPFKFSALINKNILIVDDNQNSRRIISTYLEEAGSKVTEADSADKAIALLLSGADSGSIFDVVLVDYQMPGMNGYQFAETVYAIPVLKDMQLILLTSVARRGDAAMAGKWNFAGYLSKPIKKEELLDCVSIVLGLKKAGRDHDVLITKYVAREAKMALQPKILLVEDNETNRKLIITVLNARGMGCDIAENGEEALKACQERNYDMIFMDCQMPVMDGYEAAMKIRNFEGHGKHTPIIAMTAYAMEGDREKCLAAGMDDYISKPLDLNLLFQLIDQYSRVKPEKLPQKTITEEYIKRFVAQTGLPEADVKELFREYINALPEMIRSLEEALQKEDYLEVKRLAHQLKGSSGNLRIKIISEKAQQIETAAEGSDGRNCWALLNEIKNCRW